ncbi:MAG: hypothetical protein WCX95_00285 [Candidatus Gracilibacteria bacterium]
MNKEATPVRPHHVEGAQGYIDRSKRKGVETGKDLYDMLLKLVQDDPNAELIFVTTKTDPICLECLSTHEKCLALLEENVNEELIVQMDMEVAKEHGWDFDRPYKVQDIIDEITREAPGRSIIYAVAAWANEPLEIDGKQVDFLETWRAEVRASKKRAIGEK